MFERGTAVFSYDEALITYADGSPAERVEKDKNLQAVEGGKDYWGFRHAEQIAKFYEALAGKRAPELTGEEALKTHRLICAIYEDGKKHFTANT